MEAVLLYVSIASAKLAKLHNSESDCIHIVILPMIDGRARVTSEPNKADLVNGGQEQLNSGDQAESTGHKIN